MNTRTCAASVLLISLVASNAGACDTCDKILETGIFNVVQFDSNKTVEENYRDFTHTDEAERVRRAQREGLEVFIPLEGGGVLPLKRDFSEEEWREWIRRRTEVKERRLSSYEATTLFNRSADPGLVAVLLKCKEMDAAGLSVSLAHFDDENIVLTIRWKPTPGGGDAKIDQIESVNCTVMNMPESRTFVAHVPFGLRLARRNSESEAVVIINTDKGQRTVTVPPTRVIRTNVEYAGETRLLNLARLVIADGVTIRVRNGALFEVQADEIIVAGRALIDGTGEPGGEGAPGAAAGEEWPAPKADYFAARAGNIDRHGGANVCTQGHDEQQHRDCGGRGGKGLRGESGATVRIRYRSGNLGQLQIKTPGGPGGQGGPGGSGRYMFCRDCKTCDGGEYRAPSGPRGPTGDVGPPGSSSESR